MQETQQLHVKARLPNADQDLQEQVCQMQIKFDSAMQMKPMIWQQCLNKHQ